MYFFVVGVVEWTQGYFGKVGLLTQSPTRKVPDSRATVDSDVTGGHDEVHLLVCLVKVLIPNERVTYRQIHDP